MMHICELFRILSTVSYETSCFIQGGLTWHTSKTRAPRGIDGSPEYNEHFCYKLESRVKNLTTEWNEKQQHFITHASRSLLWIRFVAVAFRSEEEVFWRRGPPWPILPRPGSAPGQIWPKHLYACAGPWALHPYQVSYTSIKQFCSKGWLCVHALVHPPPFSPE